MRSISVIRRKAIGGNGWYPIGIPYTSGRAFRRRQPSKTHGVGRNLYSILCSIWASITALNSDVSTMYKRLHKRLGRMIATNAVKSTFLTFMNVWKLAKLIFDIQRYSSVCKSPPKRLSRIPWICVSELAHNFSNSVCMYSTLKRTHIVLPSFYSL